MKIHEVEQNTLDWLKLHIGIPTAGGLGELVDSKFITRTGEMPKTYLCKKLAEAYRGKPLISLGSDGFNSFSVEQGMILEEEALPYFELQTNATVQRVGFITTDDGKFGCSPDGLILGKQAEPIAGLEIKCPAAETHVKYLLGASLPTQYAAQVHGGLYATGLERWVFMSYRRGFPGFFAVINRDEAIIQRIQSALAIFQSNFENAKHQLNTAQHETISNHSRSLGSS